MLPPQTLLTSTVASFPDIAVPADETEVTVTPELISILSPTTAETVIDGKVPESPSQGSKGTIPLENENEELGESELENLLVLWMFAKIREASTSLSSLISNLYREKLLSDETNPSVFTAPSERWGDALERIRSWVTHRSRTWMGICDKSRVQNGSPREDGKSKPSDCSGDPRVLGEIPSYVLDHAPYVHLFSNEQYWPSDISVHLNHIIPELNYTPILPSSEQPNLTDLDELNQWERGLNVYLTSKDDVETKPDWLASRMNIPQPLPGDGDTIFDLGLKENISGGSRKLSPRRKPGKSEAPAVLIVVEKEEGIVDAFWFFFYSFNEGNKVFNIRFGSHVGDWEHTLVRFENGEPKTIFCSEHSFGEAFTYNAAEKIGKRVWNMLFFISMNDPMY